MRFDSVYNLQNGPVTTMVGTKLLKMLGYAV